MKFIFGVGDNKLPGNRSASLKYHIYITKMGSIIVRRPQLPYVLGNSVIDKLLREYDEGKFIHLPGGGGEILAENFYGETAIPEKYIRREWTKKFRIEKIVGPNSHLDQNVIIAQKIHWV